jgi:hypothetical protein
MKNLSTSFLMFAFATLVFIAGAWIWHKFTNKPRIITKIEWYEKSVYLPPATESHHGQTIIINSRDTVFRDAPCDSLRDWARTRLQPFSTVFSFPIAAVDSFGSFTVLEIDSVYTDPFTRTITLGRYFQDALLKLSRVTTTETVTEIDWFVSLGTFVLGVLIALLVS